MHRLVATVAVALLIAASPAALGQQTDDPDDVACASAGSDVECEWVAVSVEGEARCQRIACTAVSVRDDAEADNGHVAVSLLGNAHSKGLAVGGQTADGELVAVALSDRAFGYVAVSPVAEADGCIVASGTGYADGDCLGVSGTGDARGCAAVSLVGSADARCSAQGRELSLSGGNATNQETRSPGLATLLDTHLPGDG